MNCHCTMGPAQPHQPLLRGDNNFCREQCQAVTPSPAKGLKELCVSPLRWKCVCQERRNYVYALNTLWNSPCCSAIPKTAWMGDGGWGGGGGGLHVFCELLAFWSAGAWGQRCCHDFLIAGLRMAVHSIGLGAWIRSQLSLTANDHY